MSKQTLVRALLCILAVYCNSILCCPTSSHISKIINDLETLGFRNQLRSEDDFASSFRCLPCQSTVSYLDATKVSWLLRRHSETDKHKRAAGWTLTADYKVVKSIEERQKTISSFWSSQTAAPSSSGTVSKHRTAKRRKEAEVNVLMQNELLNKATEQTRKDTEARFACKLSETVIRSTKESILTKGQVTAAEMQILREAGQAKIRQMEQNNAVIVNINTVIRDCLTPKPITFNYKEIFSQCTTITSAVCNDVYLKKEAGLSTVKHVAAIMDYIELQDRFRKKIEVLQRHAMNLDLELDELRGQVKKDNLQSNVPEIALKLACLMKEENREKKEPFLKILSDLICNKGKETKRWSDETNSLFAIIVNYGGPALVKIVRDRLGGPHLRNIYRTARSDYTILSHLSDESFVMARKFYSKIGYFGPFTLAIDATTIVGTLRVKGNKIIGFATEDDISVTTAQDIIDVVNSKTYEKARLANAFVLSPVVEHVASFTLCISPVVKGQDYQTIREWMNKACNSASFQNLEIIGIGADGDSKFRKFYFQEYKRIKELQQTQITVNYEGFNFAGTKILNENGSVRESLMFPDWRHLIKKWRNQLLNVKRILLMGKHMAKIEHLMEMYPFYKIECCLWKSDVYVRDKQNVDAATRVLKPEVRSSLKKWNEQASIATRVYLKLGESIYAAFTKREISVRERAKFAWLPTTFLRLWRAWLKIEEFPLDSYFISQQSYDDIVLAGHSIVISMKLYAEKYPNLPYQPWMFGSDSCEVLFSRLRGFCRGNPNLSLMDMMDFARRIQKLNELNQKQFYQIGNEHWPKELDAELILGLEDAEREALKTVEVLGMVDSLVNGNILARTSTEDLVLLNPAAEVIATRIDIVDMPDESAIFEVEDLLEIENDLLLTAIDNNQQEYTSAMINIAATTSSSTDHADEEEEYDDDAPSNCFFYKNGKCHYQEKSFKPPKNTNWIGCEFPGCSKWFHQECLGLTFPSIESKESYCYFCKDHPTSHYAKNKVVTSSDDEDILAKDSPPQCKRPRVVPSAEDSSRQGVVQDYRNKPNYVEYEGVYYHIAEFLSLQQGKAYMPATSRNARWMSVSKANFYENVGKIVPHSEKHITSNSFVAFWNEGLLIGKVVRMYFNPTTKSAYPILEWNPNDRKKSNLVTCCVKVAPVDVESNSWVLNPKNRFVWSPAICFLCELVITESSNGFSVENIQQIKDMLPKLREEERKRKINAEKEKQDTLKRRKVGPAEDMTVLLLKEVLSDMGVIFRNSSSKPELIRKVKEARAAKQADETQRNQRQNNSTKPTSSKGNSNYLLYYYDPNDRKRFMRIIILFIIYSLFPILEWFSALLDYNIFLNFEKLVWMHLFLISFVFEVLANLMLIIYRMILEWLRSLIFASAQVSLADWCLEETAQIERIM